MTPKRKKPFAATLASTKELESDGWTVAKVEQRIPHTFITRDAYNFADLLCCSPSKGIMLVQVTGDTHGKGNFNARIEKIKLEARAGIWMASGGRIQVHSWETVKGEKHRTCRIFEIGGFENAMTKTKVESSKSPPPSALSNEC